MKTNRNLLVASILGAVLAISLCAGLASAQLVFRGKFTLPYDVSWQSTVLPAGEYSFTMDSLARPVRIIVRGMGKAGGAARRRRENLAQPRPHRRAREGGVTQATSQPLTRHARA